MTRNSTLFGGLICILVISCKKSDTNIFRRFKPELKNCQVAQIIQPSASATRDTMVFTYNQWGNPVSITQLPSPKTGAPSYIFKYDKKRRLTDIIGIYNESGAEFWHKYFYQNPGNSDIVLDSAYDFVSLQNGRMTSYHSASATYYKYDKMGRIIKDSSIFNGGQLVRVNDYSYDATGNLVGRVYDDKVNIHQTNKIWMFFDRDYSVNNPFVAETYNRFGLPTKVNLSPKNGSLSKFITGLQSASISYTCD